METRVEPRLVAEDAGFLLSRLLGDVILRPDKQGLVAEVRGNLGVLLEDGPSIGAGSPFLALLQLVRPCRIRVGWLSFFAPRGRRMA